MKFRRFLALTLMLVSLMSFSAQALSLEDTLSYDSYSVGSPNAGMTFTIEDDTIYVESVGLVAYGMIFSIRCDDDRALVSITDVDGDISTSYSLEALIPDYSYAVTVSLAYTAEKSPYANYVNGENVILVYQGNAWQFSPVASEVYAHNYNLFYGNNLLTFDDTGIDETVIAKSDEICGGLTDDYEKLIAIDHWVAENIYYNYDYLGGLSSVVSVTAADVLDSRTSVCEGYANLVRDLVLAQGIPCLKVSGYALGLGSSGSWDDLDIATQSTTHAWNEAYLESEDRWVIIDSTWNSDCDYKNGSFIYDTPRTDYFDISLSRFSEDHLILKTDKGDSDSDVFTMSDWAVDNIDQAVARDILHKDLWNNFTLSVSRAEFCKLASGLLEVCSGESLEDLLAITDTSDRTTVFSDTKNDYVAALYQLGMVNGTGDGQFTPDATITRQEAAKLIDAILTFFEAEGISGTAPTFSDQNTIADWAADSVSRVASLGIMEGTGEGFDPLGTYTLEQAIVTMNRLYDCLMDR